MSSHQSRDWWYFYTQVAPVQHNLIFVNKHAWQISCACLFFYAQNLMALNFREMPTGGKRKKGDRVMRNTLPMKLQLFAEGGDGNGGQSAGGANEQAGQQGNQNNQHAAGVDYDKIQAMLDNATAKKENAVLKSYFQQQGLSEDEISQAIATFKQNKQQQTEQQQNANASLQNEVAAAQKVAEQAQIELAATKVAMTLGINAKTVPYVLKMADFSKAKGTDGKISEDNVKSALEQVLKDVPALKPATDSNGGFQIGGPGGGNTNQANEEALKRAFGL